MRAILLLSMLYSFQSLAFAQSSSALAEYLLRREIRERKIPGLQAAIVIRGKIIFSKSFGMNAIQQLKNLIPTINKNIERYEW